MADDDYRLRLATALVTRNPVGILVDAVMAVRDDQLHAAENAISHVRQLCEEVKREKDTPGRWLLANLILAVLDGPGLSEVSVLRADLDLVMNHAGDPTTVAAYPAAAQRIQDALGGRRA